MGGTNGEPDFDIQSLLSAVGLSELVKDKGSPYSSIKSGTLYGSGVESMYFDCPIIMPQMERQPSEQESSHRHPPRGGWRAHTYYIVEVCFDPNNPCFGAIFYTGFMNGYEGGPGAYNYIVSAGIDPEDKPSIRDVVFLRAIRTLANDEELDNIPNRYKLPASHETEPLEIKPIDTDSPQGLDRSLWLQP